MKTKTIYKNEIINILADLENCRLYFISFTGKVRALNIDDNFYTAQDDYDTYCYLLNDMVDDNDISEEDYSDYVKRFSKWLKRQIKDTSDADSVVFDKPHYEKRITTQSLLNDLLNRLTDNYNNDVDFEQQEEDRLIIRDILNKGVI